MAGDAGDRRLDLDTLLAIARNGWALHPLKPGRKEPATEHGLKDATTDEETLTDWWNARQDMNWGTPSATVADIDRLDQADDLLDILPIEAPTQNTASGNKHVLMRSEPGRRLPGKLPGGVGEWRAAGRGYVVVYDPAVFLMHSPPSLPEVPPELYDARAPASATETEPLTSRGELIALAGSLRHAGLTRDAILEALDGMLDRGEIANADPAWPWTTPDLEKIADEAGKWAPGEVVPMPVVRTRSGTALGPDPDDWLGAVPLSEVEAADPRPLVLSRIHPTGHTILYGTGGVGKGVVAASWIAELTAAGERVLLLDYEQNPDEWSRRVAAFGGDPSLVLIALPHSLEWRGTRGPIWKQATEMAALAERWGAGYVFVDSIVMAAAGAKDPYSPEAPALYATALERIGLPVVSLAHVNRSDDGRYPFGSVFWHNLARITWSLEAPEDGAPTRTIRNRKANSYKVAPAQAIDWAWVDDEDMLPARLSYGDLNPSTQVRIAEALDRLGGTASVDAITTEVVNDGFEAMSKSNVGKTLKRYSRKNPRMSMELFSQRVDNGPWSRVGHVSTVATRKAHADHGDVSTEESTDVHGHGDRRPSDMGVDSVHPYGGDVSTQPEERADSKPRVTRERSRGAAPKRKNLR